MKAGSEQLEELISIQQWLRQEAEGKLAKLQSFKAGHEHVTCMPILLHFQTAFKDDFAIMKYVNWLLHSFTS